MGGGVQASRLPRILREVMGLGQGLLTADVLVYLSS
jgi:hypothetical protein